MRETAEALVVNFQDYSVHDGCGLRSLVFLKGCALACKWCQNPECIKPGKEIIFREQLCAHCDRCFAVCPAGAIKEGSYRIDHRKCTMCGRCTSVCQTGALKEVGQWMSSESLVRQIEKYKVFYDNSDNGGITLSGGEPLFQLEFSMEVLQRCMELGIHTAIETSAYSCEEAFIKSFQHVRLLLIDIKHMDEWKHISGTGVSNAIILNNLKAWAKTKNRPDCVIRIPLIPDYNDDEANVRETCKFVKTIGVQQVDLLPFNIMASSKYKEIGIHWEYQSKDIQTYGKLEALSSIVTSYGLAVTIGGLW